MRGTKGRRKASWQSVGEVEVKTTPETNRTIPKGGEISRVSQKEERKLRGLFFSIHLQKEYKKRISNIFESIPPEHPEDAGTVQSLDR